MKYNIYYTNIYIYNIYYNNYLYNITFIIYIKVNKCRIL